jgi:hypothetical protein
VAVPAHALFSGPDAKIIFSISFAHISSSP